MSARVDRVRQNLLCLSAYQRQQCLLLRGRPSFICLRWAQLSSVLLDLKVTPFYSPAVKIT